MKRPIRIAFLSEHASPLALLGSQDAGGQNVYVDELSRQLGHLGYAVDVFTRRDSGAAPEVVAWAPGVRVINLAVGPPLDMIVLRQDALELEISCRIEPDEPYFHGLRESWSAALRAAHIAIPAPPYWETAKRKKSVPAPTPLQAV